MGGVKWQFIMKISPQSAGGTLFIQHNLHACAVLKYFLLPSLVISHDVTKIHITN